jgi:hypothetical protein
MSPRVVCICLTRDRPRFLDRARRCFEAQTYPNKRLYVINTAFSPFADMTIGALRNIAVHAAEDADVIAHWDDDDWSGPERLTEQVEMLTPDVDAVGYRDMLFYDSQRSEAWLYRGAANFCVGTSLMYWRRTWERKRFADTSEGEDGAFQLGLVTRSVPAGMRMIAEIHGTNTWGKIYPKTNEFSRSPQFDAECRKTLGYDRT